KEEPTPIHVEERLLMRLLNTGHFTNSIVMLEIDGKPVRTLPKDVAVHPVTDRPLHADFLRLAKDAKIQVAVPVVFLNEEGSPGIKKGGVLNVVRHELELVCVSDKISDQITIDLTGLEIGDAVHISHASLPAGSESAITDRDFTIATVVVPSAMKQTEGEAVEAGAVPTEDEAAEEGGEEAAGE